MMLVAGLCLLCLAPAFAGRPSGDSRQPLRVTTRVVEISVVAEGGDGKPVQDLAREDFTLLDEGRPQELAFFSVETARMRRPNPKALPPNTFSNRLEQVGDAPTSATVILFDGLNTPIIDQAYARQQILKFLKELQPGDRVAIYVMGRGPRVLQDFTEDTGTLLEALSGYKGEQAPSLDAPLYDPAVRAGPHFDAWLGELTFNLIQYFDRDRAFRTVRALAAIASHLERLPGRKNLIWVAGSFPVDVGGDSLPLTVRERRGPGGSPETGRAVRALHRANVAVYPVDARGLMAPQDYRADRNEVTRSIPGADQATFSAMRKLAERTGGRAFYNNNDLKGAFRRAADDARLTYILGYYPSHDEWNGKFREIKVEVSRPDVRLHHRSGYFAQPEEPADAGYREEVLETATWSPVDASGLGLTVHVTPDSGGTVNLDLQLDARDIAFQAKECGWECGLDIWLVQLDERERHLKTTARTNNLRLDPLTYQRVMRAQGLMLTEKLKPSSKATLLRVLVRDIDSGALGSVTIPVRRILIGRGTAEAPAP